MRWRMIVGWLVVLAATGGAVDKKLPVVPQEPAPKKPESRVHPTPERLAGTWELTHHNGIPSGNFKVTRVFGKDGSLTVTSNVTQPNVHTGKYRIEGDVVHSMLNSTSEYGKHSQFTVTKLTDDTLEVVGTADDDYTTGVFKRVK